MQALSAKYTSWTGIGDGCTTLYGGYLIDIAAFESTFTPACNGHDKCFITIGRTGWDCNSIFLSDMQSACQSKFNRYLRPVEYTMCMDTALKYYQAVQAYVQFNDPTKGLQRDMLNEVRIVNNQINTDSCGMTPEGSSFFAPSVISKVNDAFLSKRNRLPTVYEFFSVLSSGNIVDNTSAWETDVLGSATSFAPYSVPTMNYTIDSSFSGVLNVNPVQGGVDYMWKLNGTTYNATSVTFSSPSKFDKQVSLKGFVRAKQGTVRNMSVIDTNVTVKGWCATAPGPGVNCY